MYARRNVHRHHGLAPCTPPICQYLPELSPTMGLEVQLARLRNKSVELASTDSCCSGILAAEACLLRSASR